MRYGVCELNHPERLSALIVDDEKIERRGLAMLFEKLSLPFAVEDAANGEEAMKKLKAKPYDVLLTDIQMPFMDGLSLSHEARKLFPHMPIVIFTAFADFEKAQRAIQERVVRYLLKPVNVIEFKELMEDIANLAPKRQQAAKHQSKLERDILEYRSNEMAAYGGGAQLSGAASRQTNHHTVRLALEIIHREYMTDLGLSEVAERLFITPPYFSTLFRREVGKSFVHYLNDYRLQHAAVLLLTSSRPVKEIAAAIGFPSNSYFIQLFREKHGCTPQQYRQQALDQGK